MLNFALIFVLLVGKYVAIKSLILYSINTKIANFFSRNGSCQICKVKAIVCMNDFDLLLISSPSVRQNTLTMHFIGI